MTDYERIKKEFNFSLLKKKGDSGVYIGSGDMPEGCNIQINPEGSSNFLEKLKAEIKSELMDEMHPIGCLYWSDDPTEPSVLFGVGTWELIKDKFILAAGDTYSAGTTGGEANHTLTISEGPAHAHTLYITGSSSSGGSEYYLYASGLTKVYASSARNTMTTRSAGGGQAHNNMPPYIAKYVWERIA